MSTDLASILRQTALLREVPDEDLHALVAASRLRHYRRGQVVFSRDDPSDTVIVVVSGRVKVVVRSADGGELTLTIVPAGAVLGELSAADGGPRSTDAETLDDCRLLLIPSEAVQDVCARIPAASRALAASVAATLRRLTDAAADLVFLDLPRRVAKILLSQPRDANGTIRLGLSQEELAHQVGSTRQSVNAALRGFEKRGWLELRDRAVTVRDAAALSRFAGIEVSVG
jgi:CRP/FNR family transcriptional regulator, cyclic AMP receptor protein